MKETMIDLWTITAVLMFTTREFPLLLSRREQFIYKTHCTILGSSSTPGLRHLLGSCNMHKNNNIIIISFNDNQNMLIPHHAMPQIPDSLWAWTGKVVLQSLTAVAESATAKQFCWISLAIKCYAIKLWVCFITTSLYTQSLTLTASI